MPPPDHTFRHPLAPHHIDDEARQEAAQTEAAAEPVGEGGQVGLAARSVVRRMDGAGRRCTQVAQHGIDPLEIGQVLRLVTQTFGNRHAGQGILVGHLDSPSS